MRELFAPAICGLIGDAHMLRNRAAARCRQPELWSARARAQERRPDWASLAMPAEVGRLSAAFPDHLHHDHRAAISVHAFLLGFVGNGSEVICFTFGIRKCSQFPPPSTGEFPHSAYASAVQSYAGRAPAVDLCTTAATTGPFAGSLNTTTSIVGWSTLRPDWLRKRRRIWRGPKRTPPLQAALDAVIVLCKTC